MIGTNYSLFVHVARDMQEIAPSVPLYATAYLKLDEEIEEVVADSAAVSNKPCKFLRTCFTQPGALPDFLARIRQHKVCYNESKQGKFISLVVELTALELG